MRGVPDQPAPRWPERLLFGLGTPRASRAPRGEASITAAIEDHLRARTGCPHPPRGDRVTAHNPPLPGRGYSVATRILAVP